MRTASSIVALCLLPASLLAQFGDPVERNPEAAPIARLLEELGPDVQRFNQHVVTLANPFMEGRVPGSRGMEIAREYFEYWLKDAGLEPAFPVAGKEGARSYRQPFPLVSRTRTATEQFAAVGDLEFSPGDEFTVLGLGDSGEVTAPVSFVGYAVSDGPDGYASFAEEEDLSGRIALVLRFEPLDPDGKSRWATDRQPWSRNSQFAVKARNVARRNAAGMIIVDPPRAADERNNKLTEAGGGGRRYGDFPVVHMTQAACERMLAVIAPELTLAELCARADENGETLLLPDAGQVTLRAKLEAPSLTAANVGGVLRGRGALADEWVVIGGHLDHLGRGAYGMRDPSRKGEIHPGADDNASGSAAVLMLGDKLARSYAELPPGTPARSILFIGFDAEEAGLHGAFYYVNHPLAPLEDHALVVNFDMIGRIVNKRLSVSGGRSAVGMEEWLDPLFAGSSIEVVTDAAIPGGSDHMAFMQKQVPYLFAIIADFHADYHTPEDVTWKINREDAVQAIHLFHQIGLTAATRSAPFEWSAAQGRGGRESRR